MKVGIIDADLIGRSKHRFPNLVCEKISGYWKSQTAEVHLLMDYYWTEDFTYLRFLLIRLSHNLLRI